MLKWATRRAPNSFQYKSKTQVLVSERLKLKSCSLDSESFTAQQSSTARESGLDLPSSSKLLKRVRATSMFTQKGLTKAAPSAFRWRCLSLLMFPKKGSKCRQRWFNNPTSTSRYLRWNRRDQRIRCFQNHMKSTNLSVIHSKKVMIHYHRLIPQSPASKLTGLSENTTIRSNSMS